MLRQLLSTFAPQKDVTSFRRETQSEEKLQFSELRYRRLFETAQDGILILDADSGKIEDVNPFLTHILGYSREELVGKELWEIGVFKDIADSKAAFLKLQTEGYIRYKDLPLQTKSGKKIEVEFVSNSYLVGEQQVIQCNIRDITDRRQAEEAVKNRTVELEQLTQSQEETKSAMLNVMEDLEEAKSIIEIEKAKDEAMLASIGEGLIAVDNNRRIITINKSAEEMLGLRFKDVVGHEISSFPLEDEDGNELPLDKRPNHVALGKGRSVSRTYFSLRKDKTRFPIAITVTPIKFGGKIIGAIDIFRDITHEKEVDRAKSEFVSLASHQLRTPLGIMKWYLEALKNEDYFRKSPSRIMKYYDEIYKSNERVLNLVRDLLSVSRIDQGQVKNVPSPVNCAALVTEVVEQMQIIARKKKIDLRLSINDKHIVLITIDALRLHEVVENLINNAIEYTLPLGSVHVSISKEGEKLVIHIKDTGIGISPMDQKMLFAKFFRSEKAANHNPEGTGLGLYVVKSYVEGWGGTISVKSIEGKGSTFSIRIPILRRNTKNSVVRKSKTDMSGINKLLRVKPALVSAVAGERR